MNKDESTIAFDIGLKAGKQAFKDKVIEIIDKEIKSATKADNTRARAYFRIIKQLIIDLKIL